MRRPEKGGGLQEAPPYEGRVLRLDLGCKVSKERWGDKKEKKIQE